MCPRPRQISPPNAEFKSLNPRWSMEEQRTSPVEPKIRSPRSEDEQRTKSELCLQQQSQPDAIQTIRPKNLKPLSRRRRPWVSRDVSHFRQVEQVGEGTYG